MGFYHKKGCYGLQHRNGSEIAKVPSHRGNACSLPVKICLPVFAWTVISGKQYNSGHGHCGSDS